MASGAEHYREAERLLAAATAMSESGAMPGADFDAWAAVAGTTPKAPA